MKPKIAFVFMLVNSFILNLYSQESKLAIRLAEINRNSAKVIEENMILLSGGKFRMGDNNAGEKVHSEYVSPFWINKYEVTQAEWTAIMGYNPSEYQAHPFLPVTNVYWEECFKFTEKLNYLIGKALYRLPTEAEWEYACRAGSSAAFCFGDSEEELKEYGWFGDNISPVGQLKPNAWGLYDMHGKVQEWCLSDEWAKPARGGSCGGRGTYGGAKFHSEYIGFRLVKNVTAEDDSAIKEIEKAHLAIARERILKRINDNMIKIPGGTFMMGSNLGYDNEKPVHRVTVRPFMISKYEATQEEWEIVTGEDLPQLDIPHNYYYDHNLPIEHISWFDCQKFIKKLNELTGKEVYRLPTEAEWEYACRAGTTTEYFFGDWESPIEEYAWTINNSKNYAQPVGKLKPNPWGLYDIYGNVSEWCQDWHGDYPSSQVIDPKGLISGSERVYRNEAYWHGGDFFRSSKRNFADPNERNRPTGLRLVKTSETLKRK